MPYIVVSLDYTALRFVVNKINQRACLLSEYII